MSPVSQQRQPEIEFNQDGEAAGLAPPPAGLAILPPLGLASPAGLDASAGEASGDEAVPCSLLQAEAAKNIEMRASIRTLRITPPWDRAVNAREYNSLQRYFTHASYSSQHLGSVLSWPVYSRLICKISKLSAGVELIFDCYGETM